MFIKIGSVEIARNAVAQYLEQSYAEGSIGIRGHAQSNTRGTLSADSVYIVLSFIKRCR